jgi:hypothetical protein
MTHTTGGSQEGHREDFNVHTSLILFRRKKVTLSIERRNQ